MGFKWAIYNSKPRAARTENIKEELQGSLTYTESRAALQDLNIKR